MHCSTHLHQRPDDQGEDADAGEEHQHRQGDSGKSEQGQAQADGPDPARQKATPRAPTRTTVAITTAAVGNDASSHPKPPQKLPTRVAKARVRPG
jgi:hypothetical protein